MSAAAGARPLVLTAVALVAAVGALATQHRVDPPSARPAVLLPLDGAWEAGRAVPLDTVTAITGCPLVVGPGTLAVTHPTLPCGLRVVLEIGGATAIVQVAGRSALVAGGGFGLTPALARALGVTSARPLRWALAARR